MAEHTSYKTGARKLVTATGPDPKDDFSQKAAENKRPPLGVGLSEKSNVERSEADKSDLRRTTPKDDARGQSESNHAGGTNDGMVSADPRVLSGKTDGDATFPIKREKR